MNSAILTWLARSIVATVVLSALWLAQAAHEADQPPRQPRLAAAGKAAQPATGTLTGTSQAR